MPTTATTYWIILAWITMDGREQVRPARSNGLYSSPAEFRAAPEARACTWRCGDIQYADHSSAANHAAKYGYAVFTFPEGEEDPLGRARSAALAAFRRGELAAVS